MSEKRVARNLNLNSRCDFDYFSWIRVDGINSRQKFVDAGNQPTIVAINEIFLFVSICRVNE